MVKSSVGVLEKELRLFFVKKCTLLALNKNEC